MTTTIGAAPTPETTGRWVVTFREGASSEALQILANTAGLASVNMVNSADFGAGGVVLEEVPDRGGIYFERLEIAVVTIEESAVAAIAPEIGESSAILAIEPEGVIYAFQQSQGLSVDYLRGFRDASETLYSQARNLGSQGGSNDSTSDSAESFTDTPTVTWGLQATKVEKTNYSGKGIKVAVLDTGLDMTHPDFFNRTIVSKSCLIDAATVQDGHGHGTHCIGTACGALLPSQGRRYGIAHGAQIFAGKVLSDNGRGSDINILSGIDWALVNGCHVISLSLGGNVQGPSVAYEAAGQRALNVGTLIVAAAGNNARRSSGNFGFVGRPANCLSFLAVGAIDSNLALGDFSARDTARTIGTAVDIVGPGVNVYSSWPMPLRTRSIDGTSMATPHVAGVAALWAEATGDRGKALWKRMTANSRTLLPPFMDVGFGLVQAP